jgi:hypothetical protein
MKEVGPMRRSTVLLLSLGHPLTFRAVIVSGGVTIDLDYAVEVHR